MKAFAAALVLSAAFLATLEPARADALIDNVTGLTPDESGAIETFDAVLIGDDGRIAEIYGRNDKRPKKVDFRLDAKGRVMIPGIVDSHANVMELGLALLKARAGIQEDPLGGPRPEDRDLAFSEAQALLLSRGITTVTDMGTTIEDWQTYRRTGDRDALRIRLVAYAEGAKDMALIGGPRPTPWLYGGRLKQVGVVLSLDGLLETSQAWLKQPYAGTADERGRESMNETQLRNSISRGAIDNFQVAIRATGDAAVAGALDGIEELALTYKGDRRWRIEGVDLVDQPDIARFATNGVIASMQPQRLGIESSLAPSLLGPAREGEVQRWRSLVAAGVPVVFGSGTRGEAPSPFAAMALAMTRRTENAQPPEGWQPHERLPRETVLAAFTSNAARALFAENRIGRIAKGQEADFLFIDRDPLVATPAELAATRVLETWVGGVKVYDVQSQAARDVGQEAIDSYRGR